ncbi:MAG TPA: magnesium transporter [Pseudomonadales bacterium]|nr:magnesium transporter [Pseudomonadales bacterium]
MSQMLDKQQTLLKLDQLNEALSGGTFVQVRRMLNSLSVPNVAALLESSPPKNRRVLWQLVDKEQQGEVLTWLNEEIQSQLLRTMGADQLAEITDELDDDDIADILQNLPDAVIEEVLSSMSEQDRLRVEQMLSHDEDTAGGLMNTDTITIHPRVTLDVVLRYLRMHKELPPTTDCVFVVNNDDQLVGLLPISKILTTDPAVSVREVMVTDVKSIPADMPANEVANLFERYDWITAPVVDPDGKLLGRITVDDVIDVIIDEADHSLMSMAGLTEEEDVFAPTLKVVPLRAVWLGINLMTAFMASWVVGQFEGTIQKVVALAVLMPIVAGMGGVAGTQTLTIVIRGLALGQITRHNANWLLGREVMVGLINGFVWAAVVGTISTYWFSDIKLGCIIGGAMVINMFVAALAGAMLPLVMKRMKIDPALAGGVILTTFTDCMGFFAFLGLATWFYF